MENHHQYTSQVRWTGNTGSGTSSYRGYKRSWEIAVPNKPVVSCSNDPLLGGDTSLYNPEDLLLSSLSACHMLWYLHLASEAGITVSEYVDRPVATGEVQPNGAGRFLSAILRPAIVIDADSSIQEAQAIHGTIHQYCFISRSLNFPVTYEPETRRLSE